MNNKTNSSFADLVKLSEDSLKPIARELRKIILDIDPTACEVIRLGDKAATYGVGPKKMSEGYCHIIPHKAWVNLGFYQGAHLTDPKSLLEGTGKNIRHIKIHSLEATKQPAIKSLIREAIAERRRAINK